MIGILGIPGWKVWLCTAVFFCCSFAIQLFLSHLNGLFLVRSGFGYSVMLLLFHMQAASALAALTIISKEIVETTISDYDLSMKSSANS
jgi:hypothetical protein